MSSVLITSIGLMNNNNNNNTTVCLLVVVVVVVPCVLCFMMLFTAPEKSQQWATRAKCCTRVEWRPTYDVIQEGHVCSYELFIIIIITIIASCEHAPVCHVTEAHTWPTFLPVSLSLLLMCETWDQSSPPPPSTHTHTHTHTVPGARYPAACWAFSVLTLWQETFIHFVLFHSLLPTDPLERALCLSTRVWTFFGGGGGVRKCCFLKLFFPSVLTARGCWTLPDCVCVSAGRCWLWTELTHKRRGLLSLFCLCCISFIT